MKYILSILLLFIGHLASTQVVSDVFRYSYFEDFSTARSLAIGNAIAPLGGDFFTLSSNPAGVATYRFSEFTVSTGFRNSESNSQLGNGGEFIEDKNDFILNNMGLVIVHNAKNSKWQTINFGFGYNRNNSFDRRAFYSGSTRGSITDRWLERANGVALDDLLDYEAGLAYDAGALYSLDPNDDNGEYGTDYELDADSTLDKREQYSATGGMGEFTFAFGGNYDNRLYFGASFGIPLVNYTSRRNYIEDDTRAQRISNFETLDYEENLSQSGGGVNVKLGLTYLISQAVRWSLHFNSGSRITVIDEFSNRLTYTYDEGMGPITNTASFPGDDGTLNFEYTMVTPYRFGTGLGFIMGRNGFLSAAIEFTDYTAAKFEFDESLSSTEDLDYERELNASIDDLYKGAFTFRVGGELALESLRLRAGGVLKQRPFAGDSGFDYGWSTGLGIRINRVFLDFAYRRFVEESNYQPYPISNDEIYPIQEVATTDVFNDFVLTFGVKF